MKQGKRCTKCKKFKVLSEFCKNVHAKDKHNFRCKTCCSEQQKVFNRKHPKYQQGQVQKWNKNNPEKRHKHQLRCHYKRMYNLSLEDLNEMFLNQNNKCAICGIDQKDLKKRKGLAVDHNHKTGKIRALLCGKCNRALGGFNDDIILLEKAILYLKKYD